MWRFGIKEDRESQNNGPIYNNGTLCKNYVTYKVKRAPLWVYVW